MNLQAYISDGIVLFSRFTGRFQNCSLSWIHLERIWILLLRLVLSQTYGVGHRRPRLPLHSILPVFFTSVCYRTGLKRSHYCNVWKTALNERTLSELWNQPRGAPAITKRPRPSVTCCGKERRSRDNALGDPPCAVTLQHPAPCTREKPPCCCTVSRARSPTTLRGGDGSPRGLRRCRRCRMRFHRPPLSATAAATRSPGAAVRHDAGEHTSPTTPPPPRLVSCGPAREPSVCVPHTHIRTRAAFS